MWHLFGAGLGFRALLAAVVPPVVAVVVVALAAQVPPRRQGTLQLRKHVCWQLVQYLRIERVKPWTIYYLDVVSSDQTIRTA